MASREFTTNKKITATVTNGSGTSRLDATIAKGVAAEAMAAAEKALHIVEELGASVDDIIELRNSISNLAGIFKDIAQLNTWTQNHISDSTIKNSWCVVYDNGNKQTCIYQYLPDADNKYTWKELGIISDLISITTATSNENKELLCTIKIANKSYPIYSNVGRNDFSDLVKTFTEAIKTEQERVDKRLDTLNKTVVPRRLSTLPELKTTSKAAQANSYIFVDNNGQDKKISLTAIKNLNTKIIVTNDTEPLVKEQITPGDFVVEIKN